MFGWFSKPSCPCDPAAKAWIEERLDWLSGEFRSSVFTDRPMIFPTPEFFPAKYDGSEDAVRTLLDQVCEYMDVVPSLVELDFFEGKATIGLVNESGHDVPMSPGGLFIEGDEKYHIRINISELDDIEGLVGTLAHELGHVRLMGENRMFGDEYDNELLTDLITVHMGLGLFRANGPRAWLSDFTHWPDSELRKPEYMTAPMYGYALAHVAWFWEEAKPAWLKHLNLSARANFKQGLRYLNATQDSSFRPSRLRIRAD